MPVFTHKKVLFFAKVLLTKKSIFLLKQWIMMSWTNNVALSNPITRGIAEKQYFPANSHVKESLRKKKLELIWRNSWQEPEGIPFWTNNWMGRNLWKDFKKVYHWCKKYIKKILTESLGRCLKELLEKFPKELLEKKFRELFGAIPISIINRNSGKISHDEFQKESSDRPWKNRRSKPLRHSWVNFKKKKSLKQISLGRSFYGSPKNHSKFLDPRIFGGITEEIH